VPIGSALPPAAGRPCTAVRSSSAGTGLIARVSLEHLHGFCRPRRMRLNDAPSTPISSFLLASNSAISKLPVLTSSALQGGGTLAAMNPAKRHEIFRRLRDANPNPETELEHKTAFELLISVMLSAQATDKSVNLATRQLYKRANTPAKIHALGVAGLEQYIKTIGLYRGKAKNVIETCRILLDEHGGEVPRTREALEALPGVGRKTANVVLNVAFGEATIAVDTHIFRVSNRTALAPGKDPLEVELRLLKFVPEEFKAHAHHWLILHGRYVCIARKPKCPECIIRDLCEYRDKTTPEEMKDEAKQPSLVARMKQGTDDVKMKSKKKA
jgi:endonuclease-3